MNKDIAIIGISFNIPGASDLETYYQNIVSKSLHIKPISEIRSKDLEDRFGFTETPKAGYVDRVDLFDEKYFGIPKKDAIQIDPEQRLMLEHVVRAMYNAGYNEDEILNKKAGFFHTTYLSSYRYFFDEITKSSLAAHFPGMLGTRVANYLDIRGPVIAYDTACSSSLVATYYACQSLSMGECDYAFVGGAILGASDPNNMAGSIISKTSRCLPFDKDADGAVVGEGVICLLLKTVEKAEADNDSIYAVIKGGAINHGGKRLQTITAPNPTAQKEVMVEAWEKSGIDINDLTFIEAHGTGTELGDPIEFEGILAALEEKKSTSLCSISTAKGQIGHLDSLSGLAGILRGIVSINYKIKPGQVGFKEINPHMAEEQNYLKVQESTEPWETERLRTLGVSTFGMTGTNIHMVLQEYPQEKPKKHNDSEKNIIYFGADTEEKFDKSHKFILKYVENNSDLSLNDLAYSINKIYRPAKFKRAISFSNHGELVDALKDSEYNNEVKDNRKVIFLVPKVQEWGESLRNAFFEENHKIKNHILEFMSWEDYLQLKEIHKEIIWQYLFIKHVFDCKNFGTDILFGETGKIIQGLLSETMTIEDVLKKDDFNGEEYNKFSSEGFTQHLTNLDETYNLVFCVMGKEGQMIKAFEQWNQGKELPIYYFEKESTAPQKLVKFLFDLDYSLYYNPNKGTFLQDLNFPIFNSQRCWIENKETIEEENENNEENETNTSKITKDLIVPIVNKFNDQLPNILFTHPIWGGPGVYYDLALELSDSYNCIGIENVYLRDHKAISTLNEMAELYLEEYEKEYGFAGPISILGWSFGGLTALEMVGILENRGFTEINLILLDSFVSDDFIKDLTLGNNEEHDQELVEQAMILYPNDNLEKIKSLLHLSKHLGISELSYTLKHAKVTLYKALKVDSDNDTKYAESFNNYILKLKANNVDLVTKNLEVIPVECHHSNIVETHGHLIVEKLKMINSI